MEVVRGAIDAVQPSADAKHIVLSMVLHSLAGSIVGDSHRLQQVVWNLLSNAIKFTPEEGSVELRLERAGAMARISVRDTGPGILPDLLPRIFEAFRQGDNARRVGGLGLAIVRHIVELHHGSVRADSAGVGQDATFVVELPLARGSAEPVKAQSSAPTAEDRARAVLTNLFGVRVLVVDDQADARELLTTILRRAGAQAMAVGSASAALEALRHSTVDVLASDIGMPEEDGYALIGKIRALDPERGGTIPAIAVTAGARIEDRSRALSAGFQLHVARPIDPAALTRLVAQTAHRSP